MVGDESAQARRRSLLSQELSAVDGMESSPSDRWRIADIVQPGRDKQEVGVVNYVNGLLGVSSDALDVLPSSRHTVETFLREPRSPGDEVLGHRDNRNASPDGPPMPQRSIGDTEEAAVLQLVAQPCPAVRGLRPAVRDRGAVPREHLPRPPSREHHQVLLLAATVEPGVGEEVAKLVRM